MWAGRASPAYKAQLVEFSTCNNFSYRQAGKFALAKQDEQKSQVESEPVCVLETTMDLILTYAGESKLAKTGYV